MIYNGFIYCKRLNSIINIEYDTAHPLYYWYRYVDYLIDTEENNIKKEIKDNIEKEIEKREERKKEEIKLLNNFKINDSINFLFVLEEDVQNPAFYKALFSFLKKEDNRKPLLSIGIFGLDNVITYLPVHYLDSSIWNRYINVIDNPVLTDKPKKFSERLSEVIKIIQVNYTRQLYNIAVAREFVEFQDRILGNSYLGIPGGHAAAVVPFVFHSETNMNGEALKIGNNIHKLLKVTATKKNDIEKLKNEITDIINTKDNENDPTIKIKNNITEFLENKSDNRIKWNILLIDDYGDKALKGGAQNKKEIFNQILPDKIFDKGSGINDQIIKLNCNVVVSESIEKALDKIKPGEPDDNEKIQFDIILLDYLLGRKTGENNIREYGDEFLHKLENDKELLKNRGPLGKFWILPISSFSNAMLSKLEEEGIGRISENWYIMDGADMINTPQLFLYNFLKLIELQLKTAIVTKETIIDFVVENLAGDYYENTNLMELRLNARRMYGLFMNKFGMKEALKYDAKNGSAFANSVLSYMNTERYDDLEFYEKVRKLLYLIGFGTHSDVHLMWDLSTFVDASTKEYLIIRVGDNEKKKKWKKKMANKSNDLMKQIACYIANLKSNG